MEIEKSNIFIQLFGNVNAMLYLCTQSIAPIVERKIPTCTPQCIRLQIPMLRNRCRSYVPTSSWVAQKPCCWKGGDGLTRL